MNKYKLTVEADDVLRGKSMVVIWREHLTHRTRVGIPLRGVDYKEATDRVASLHYAFEYGMNEAHRLSEQKQWDEITRSCA